MKYSRSPTTIGEHLRKRRAELGLTQAETAYRLGVSPYSLIHWENGQHEPTIRFWPGIIAFLGYDPSPLPATLGDHVRAERRRRGCSLALLARESAIDPETLALIEADTYQRIDPRVRAAYAALQGRYGIGSPGQRRGRQTIEP